MKYFHVRTDSKTDYIIKNVEFLGVYERLMWRLQQTHFPDLLQYILKTETTPTN